MRDGDRVSIKRFTRVSETLATYIERSGMSKRIAEAGVVPEWADRVGPAIAAVTEPVTVSRGTLVVAVRSSAWLMELHMMERQIVRSVNAGRAAGRIDRIRFVMANPAHNSIRSEG
jgi:predicted nucleic acid-binding Zn ribbon protein